MNWIEIQRGDGCNGGNVSIPCSAFPAARMKYRRTLRRWRKRARKRGLQKIGEEVMNCETSSARAAGKFATQKTGKRSRGALAFKNKCLLPPISSRWNTLRTRNYSR